MPTAPDAVIIGSGHNSLACAAHLAAKGWSVAVYEQAAVPGGAVKTGEYTLPGFRHDWAAMNLSLFAGSSFYRTYGEELARHGLAFAPAADCFASVFPDRTWLGVSNDAEATAARIRAENAADADTWRTLTAEFPERAGLLFALLGAPAKKRAFASLIWSTWRQAGGGGALDLGRFLASTPRAWLSETFQSPKVQALLAAWGMHLDFAPDVAGGALFPYLEGQVNQAFGMVLGQGGADVLTGALVRMIEARGGSVTCNAGVARILHQDGRATGVELADGEVVRARKAVIANVAPAALHRLTGRTDNPRYDAGLQNFSHAPGTLMIHLAMDALPDWSAGAELRRFAYVHLAPGLDQMAATYAQAQAGLLPAEPVIVCGQPTAVDPSRAPEGKHVLWLQVRMVPGHIRGDAAGEISATDWDSAAGPMAERAFDILENYAPGTRLSILGRRIVTPAMLEADNPNLVGGDQICGSHHLSQHFMFRPVRGFADGSTPIRDLYRTGAAVWPGAGTGAGPGYLLGQKLAGT
ncbi:phytoene desaturase family protein (plasmid) [Roseobacteraceae bacterium NS-SX3]